MDILPFITTDQAASLLRVSSARVRQLVGEGKIKPLPIPGRHTMFSRGDIERLALRNKLGSTHLDGAVTISPTLNEIPSPHHPRPLLYDSIVRQPHTPTSVAHLRIWGGDDGFCVVLSGSPQGSAGGTITNRIEETAQLITSIMPRIDLAKTAFVELMSRHGGIAAYELMTVSIGIERSLAAPFRHESGYEVLFDDLERALGQKPTLWHVSAYTTENIARYQRTQRPLTITHDPLRVAHRDECLAALMDSDDPTSELVLDLLAPGCEMMRTYDHTQALSDQLDLDGLQYPWPPQATTLTPAIVPALVQQVAIERKDRIPARFTQEEHDYQARLATAREHDRDSTEDTFTTDEIERMRRELIGFAESLQPPHTRTQSLLLSATEEAIDALRWTTIANHAAHEALATRLPYPDQHIVTWSCPSGDPATTKYLEHTRLLPAHEHPDLTEDERDALLDAVFISAGSSVLFGRDPQGYAVMQATDRDGYQTHCCLTRRSTNLRLQPSDTLVSASISAGHVPLFIEREGDIIGTVPLVHATNMFNFGYGGGGPGSTAGGIARMLRLSGYTVTDDASQAITRFTEDPRWEETMNAYTRVSSLLDGTYPQ